MKITNITGVLTATFAAAGSLAAAPIALADASGVTTEDIGYQARLDNGAVVQGWTISDLRVSQDVIPYHVRGTLWEATATDEAIQGSVTPIVSNLNARTADGDNYRVLFQVATPQGVNPATLAQGQKTTGKVYFDVTGENPDSVVYNAGGRDLLVWVQPAPRAPEPGAQSVPVSAGSGQSTAAPAAGAETPLAAAEAGTATPVNNPATPLPAGSQGTPLPAGSQGTPLPAGSQGTPLPAGSQGTPVPAGAEGTPLPASVDPALTSVGSQGTPLSAGSQGTPLPAGSQGTPVPAGAEGTPLPASVEAELDPVLEEGATAPVTTVVPVPAGN